jgi:predicted CXXCH cytochrome family protein
MTRLAAAVLSAVPLFATSSKIAVIGSQHDLSATGSGPVKSGSLEACVFCHAPHNVNPNITPLWDHTLSSQSYTTYSSSTYTSGIQTPGAGSSKLCLSCHDGTVAVGLTVTQGQIATSGSMNSSDVFGSNLSTSHPVSMTPADDGSLAPSLFNNPPSTNDPSVKLVGAKVECTTCHDPHVPRNDTAVPMFLVRSNAGGSLCLACHDPTRTQPNFLNGWTTSAHATASSSNVPTTAGFGAYGNVAADACSNCHLGHNNAVGPRNQRALEEAACTPCHSGANVSPPLLNVTAEFSKTYAHPTMTVSGVHDPAEALPVNNTRHAECADCHNPHTAVAQAGTALPPAIQSAMSGTLGWDTITRQTPAAREYLVCYKCHADSTNKPLTSSYGRTAVRYPQGNLPTGPNIPRPGDQYNLALKFAGAISHNVAGNSVMTTTVGSLLGNMLDVNKNPMANRPLTRTSYVYCVDCHDNNQARSNNGTGPNGPHGSTFSHLLAFNLYQDTGGGGGGGTTAYDLCARCHNITTLRNDTGVHNKHLSGDVNAGCTVCHDPHGVVGGSTVSNFAMVNLDTTIAKAPNGGTFYGVTYSGGRITCYLTCHGENHNPQSYRYP